MTDAAIALVRDIFGRWNNGEREFDETVFDPEFTVHSSLTGRVYTGDDGIREWTAEIDEQFTNWTIVMEDMSSPRADLVAVTGQIRMTGRQSGVEFEQPASWLVEVRDGRLLSLRNFIGQESAAAAILPGGK
jgi:ketosteroid isomerase-like protein